MHVMPVPAFTELAIRASGEVMPAALPQFPWKCASCRHQEVNVACYFDGVAGCLAMISLEILSYTLEGTIPLLLNWVLLV